MFAVIRRYNIHPGTTEAVLGKVSADFMDRITQLPGFVAYHVLDPKDDTIVSVSIFDSKESAAESTRMATEWVRANLHQQLRNAPVITSAEVALTTTAATASGS